MEVFTFAKESVMKPVRTLALALALGGLSAASAVAQYGESLRYPSTGRYSNPTLLPLPAASGPWVRSVSHDAAVHPHGATTSDVSPAANYVAQSNRPTVSAAPRQPSARTASPSIAQPYYPNMSYVTSQDPVPPAPPVPGGATVVPSGPTVGPNGPTVVAPVEGAHTMIGPNAYESAALSAAWGDCVDCEGLNGGCGLGGHCGHGGCGDVCGGCNIDPCCTTWYGYVGGLVMTRDRSDRFWTTFETGNNANQLAFFPESQWGGGFEATIGHMWCGSGGGCGGCTSGCTDSCAGACGSNYRHGLEFTVWGVGDMEGEENIRSETDSLSTPIDLGFVDIPAPGSPASAFFDNAREHRLRRENEFYNAEVNLVNFITSSHSGNVQYQGLLGARFFNFNEFLQFASVSGGNEFGSGGGVNEAYLDIDVDNNLYGLQIGGRADWRFHPRWRTFVGTKVGVFYNDIDFGARLYRGDGATATFATTGNAFDLRDGKDDVSMLGQIDLGLAWDFSRHWSANIGYRAVGITGLALADEQIPAFLAAEADWTDVDSNGSMILHGGFAGLEFRY
jgi:hypothetical protein